MIQVKNCKGQNKASGFEGCGRQVHVFKRKFGLCPSCLYDWMTETTEGLKYKEKQFLPKVSKNLKHTKQKEKTQAKRELMSVDKYRAKVLQPVINEIARLIDYDCPCIATGNYNGKMAGGHYHSVGSNRTLALNLHNIHIQSFHSNSWKGGDDKRYQEGLKEVYSNSYFEFVESLKGQSALHLTKPDLVAIYKKSLKVRAELKRGLEYREPRQRIFLRNLVNKRLGIYDEQFKTFKL